MCVYTRGFREEIEFDTATGVALSGEAALFSLPHPISPISTV
jgi:hypothetical protein